MNSQKGSNGCDSHYNNYNSVFTGFFVENVMPTAKSLANYLIPCNVKAGVPKISKIA